MQPLLKIQTIPINIEYKVQRASLQLQSTPAQVNVTRNRGSLGIQTTPSKLHVDTYETRASAGRKSAVRSNQEYASAGRDAGYEATRRIAEEGNQRLDSGGNTGTIANIVSNRMIHNAETVTAFIPSVRPEVSIDPGTISFNVTMDQLTFDWNINHKPQLEFVPGNIEFSVTQYPDVVIEYVGSPLYVPPSADPNYEPSEMDTTA